MFTAYVPVVYVPVDIGEGGRDGTLWYSLCEDPPPPPPPPPDGGGGAGVVIVKFLVIELFVLIAVSFVCAPLVLVIFDAFVIPSILRLQGMVIPRLSAAVQLKLIAVLVVEYPFDGELSAIVGGVMSCAMKYVFSVLFTLPIVSFA